jgi:hypothetical protein
MVLLSRAKLKEGSCDMDRPPIELTEEDKKLLAQSGMGPLQIMGEGGSSKYGSRLGGQALYRKQLGKDLDLEAYVDSFINKPKGSSTKGKVTGGGLRLTKRLKKGGSVKSSASKRADGIAVKGKTKVEKWSDVFNKQHSIL